MPECSVVRKLWSELTTAELYSFLKLRTDVFFVEQRIDEEELDRRDLEPTTEHWWIQDDAGTAAYLRTLVDPPADPHADPHAHPADLSSATQSPMRIIGRVVVRADRRGEGLAQVLMREVIASHGHEQMLLHAQEYIAPLYAKFGFVAFGEVYQEAGIPHISMLRPAD
jgi:ElaA protein